MASPANIPYEPRAWVVMEKIVVVSSTPTKK